MNPLPSSPRKSRAIRLLLPSTLSASLLVLLAFAPRSGTEVHASSNQDRVAGNALFHEKGCEHCHGADGLGTDRGPDLSSIGKQWKKPQIEKQIREGGNGMPPFGDVLQPDEVKHLVDFLASKKAKPSKTTKPPLQPIPTQ